MCKCNCIIMISIQRVRVIIYTYISCRSLNNPSLLHLLIYLFLYHSSPYKTSSDHINFLSISRVTLNQPFCLLSSSCFHILGLTMQIFLHVLRPFPPSAESLVVEGGGGQIEPSSGRRITSQGTVGALNLDNMDL